ncbi:MAG: glycosyltransferase [Crocinitomicaceae bacterium]|nr:glycosyltransferase [Flavobacteriales bacterium]NQZ34186.1 glycosyltransferase [Crocinitomicaceae bacterium]
MRVLLVCDHVYPIAKTNGAGKKPILSPSGAGCHQFDLLANGLSEKGHDVFYLVHHLPGTSSPEGVELIDAPIEDVDIVHLKTCSFPEVIAHYQSMGIPVFATNHAYIPEMTPTCEWMYVSKTLANLYGKTEYIWNGLDPKEYIYSVKKEDYFLFMADMTRHIPKGLDIALKLSKDLNFRLIVAGTAKEQEDIDKVQQMCDEYGAEYIGDIDGVQKAKVLTNARALISPSRLPESFGMTLAEALLSGTPVICSNVGAYGEIVPSEVGFVCDNESDYHHAIKNIDSIDNEKCRSYALQSFDYLNTTEKYIEFYKQMIIKSQTEKSLEHITGSK